MFPTSHPAGTRARDPTGTGRALGYEQERFGTTERGSGSLGLDSKRKWRRLIPPFESPPFFFPPSFFARRHARTFSCRCRRRVDTLPRPARAATPATRSSTRGFGWHSKKSKRARSSTTSASAPHPAPCHPSMWIGWLLVVEFLHLFSYTRCS